jgi:3-oxoacyl-[acyl-carrier protein] reductase
VSGANHGIGAETARQLARYGASVLVTYLRADEVAGESGQSAEYLTARRSDGSAVVDQIRASGGLAELVEADLADPTTPHSLFEIAEEKLGPVSILVNNASAWQQDTFTPGRVDRFGRTMSAVTAETFAQLHVDARGGALMIAEFARRHIARGADWGRIVALTSGSSDGFPDEVSYGASKAAMQNYTLSAAQELGQFGVTANVVYPPITDTGWITPEVALVAEQHSPFQRVAEPADVAEVICLLCADAARHLTANVIHVR